MVERMSILETTAEWRMVSMQLTVEQTRRLPDIERVDQLDEEAQVLGKKVASMNKAAFEQFINNRRTSEPVPAQKAEAEATDETGDDRRGGAVTIDIEPKTDAAPQTTESVDRQSTDIQTVSVNTQKGVDFQT